MNTSPATPSQRKSLIKNPLPLLLITGLIGVPIVSGIVLRNRLASSPSGEASTPSASPSSAHPVDTVVLAEDSLHLAEFSTVPVFPRPFALRLPVNGMVEADPARTARINAHVAGRVVRLLVNVGDRVTAGQVVAYLDSDEMHRAQTEHELALKRVRQARIDLERRKRLASLGEYARPRLEEASNKLAAIQEEERLAQEEIASALAQQAEAQSQKRVLESGLLQAQSKLEVVRSRRERATRLFQEQLVSRQEYEQIQADLKQAQAEVEAAKSNIGQGEARIAVVQAHHRSAQSRLESATRRLQNAQQAYGREEKIFKSDYSTTKEVTEAQSALELAQLQEEAARDEIQLLGGTPEGDHHEVRITSSIAGRITERGATLGQSVTGETPLYTVLDTRSLWVQFHVYQKEIRMIHVGQSIQLTSDSLPGQKIAATVAHIADVAEELTYTVKVRCVIDNPHSSIRPGMFVQGNIVASTGNKRFVVPEEALQEIDGKTCLFFATDRPNIFRLRQVTIGERQERSVVILSGLAAGERVVTKNAHLLKTSLPTPQQNEVSAH